MKLYSKVVQSNISLLWSHFLEICCAAVSVSTTRDRHNNKDPGFIMRVWRKSKTAVTAIL